MGSLADSWGEVTVRGRLPHVLVGSGFMLLSVFFFSSRRRHTRFDCDWSSDVCSSDLYVWNIVLPAVTMVAASSIIDRVRGPVRDQELEGLLFASREMPHGQLKESIARRLKVLEGTWLQKTLREAPSMPKNPFPVPARGLSWYQRPERMAWGYIVSVSVVLFFILW